MASAHSFFPPDAQYLSDAEGLVEHLLSKVLAGLCLAGCSRKEYESPQAAQQHMRDSHHCYVPYTSEAEVEDLEDFYDYSAHNRDDDDDALVPAGEVRDAVVLDSGDLHLPTGTVARHRDVVRYYKQRFRVGSERTPEAAALASVVAGTGSPSRAVRLAERSGARGSGPLVGGGARHSVQGARGQRREVAYWKYLAESTGIKNNKIHVWERGPGAGAM
jgi:pre-60S factor REI1